MDETQALDSANQAAETVASSGDGGLGLADAAGLTGDGPHFDLLASFWHYFQNDLISSIPTAICSFLVLAVLIERATFYNKNNRDISRFIHNLQNQLEKGNLEAAQMMAAQLNSVTGEVAEEGIRLLAVQREDFSRAYDITVSIVTRKLQKYLPILATIGAVAPFLGLFGTVSGVIKALWKMSAGSEGASMTMIAEISNALIATGFGLAVAIVAVVSYNLFTNIVKRYNDDFMLLKLLFLSFSHVDFLQNPGYSNGNSNPTYSKAATAKPQAKTDDAMINEMVNPTDKPSFPDFLK